MYMKPSPVRLDHIALWISDPPSLAARLRGELGMRELERTEDFILVGWDAGSGKLTLFGEDGPREAGALQRVIVGVPGAGRRTIDLPDALQLEVRAADVPDVLGIVLRSADPEAGALGWSRLGFTPGRVDRAASTVHLADAEIHLVAGAPSRTDRPVLNHLGALVESAADELSRLRAGDVPIAEIKDAPNTYSVFVEGPDGIRLEYVEQKPSFSLAADR
jgi:catechol 2,3-dioxygenase-like lactoylglutathione lyase family enzyme